MSPLLHFFTLVPYDKILSTPLKKFHPLVKIVNQNLVALPTPSALTSNWRFGSSLGICLLVQIVTGLFLAIHFNNSILLAFDSVVHLTNDVNFGWLARTCHANGASLFFVLIYLHVGRGLYYSRYQFKETWMSGVTIIFLLIATAFLGYVLPWGQMSFWGATVITNLISAIPYFGETLVYWIWGGFAVADRTLTRFFTFHFILPFALLGLVALHLLFLHQTGSSNPLGLNSNFDKIPFHPYFSTKDVVRWIFLFGSFLLLTLQTPWLLGDAENFLPANPLITPTHIKPEWYFLFAYAILRSIPNKLGGVIAIVLSIAILYLLPFRKISYLGTVNNTQHKFIFWLFFRLFIILTWIGGNPVEDPYIILGQIASCLYLIYFVWLILS